MTPSKRALFAASLLVLLPATSSFARRPKIRKVCNGSTAPCPHGGHYTTITKAVSRARSGDWILVWPGVYHEKASAEAGVLITTPNIHLRGLDRNLVIVDGSNGAADTPCPTDPAVQDMTSRNGIEVFKADGVTIENLTVCNYLSAGGGGGNEIWWNGGDATGLIGLGTFSGAYLTATSMFYQSPSDPLAQYGIFVSNSKGPGTISFSYASNMADSDFYVGACPDCNTVLSHVHAQNSSLGYSGTNSGGHLRIEDSEWDNNKTGVVPNSLNNDDAPPPQSGMCPDQSGSCMFIQRNHVHDNNNPNVPASGISGEAPVGIGIEISGGSFDTIQNNTVENQGSWGIVTHDFPDTETPPPISHCQGGIQSPGLCLFKAKGNVVQNNQLQHNGFFGNPSNGDLANESTSSPRNCFLGNTDSGGLTSDPPNIQTVNGPPCDQPAAGDGGLLLVELACAAGILPCPGGQPGYPQPTQVQMLPLSHQDSMPNPCSNVPRRTLFCPNGVYTGPTS